MTPARPVQPLAPGDRVGNVLLPCHTGEVVSLYDRALGGVLVVSFVARLGSEAGRACLEEAARGAAGAEPGEVHQIVVTRDASPVVRAVAEEHAFTGWILCEEDDRAANAFGVDWSAVGERVQIFVLDANQRLLRTFAANGVQVMREAARYVRDLPKIAAAALAHTAPVLSIPRVLEPDFCQRLIEAFHTRGHEEGGVYSMQDGKLVHRVEASLKKRQDHYVRDQELGGAIAARLMRRVLPEIRKAFHYEVTAAEEYKVVRYRGEEGGFFGAHRDDMSPQTAHRRFAITLNLNEGYEGGHLCFPEYGPHLYRPAAGEAVVFSCSLLHRVSPITRGDRFVLLAFLYGEDGKQQRREIEAWMARAGPPGSGSA